MQLSIASAIAYLLQKRTRSFLSHQLDYKLLGTKIIVVSFLTVFLDPSLEICRKKLDKNDIL